MQLMDIIVKDEEILGGTPVFEAPGFHFRRYWTTWKAGKLLTSFWTTFRLSPKTPRSRRLNLQSRSLSIIWDEGPA